jgi:hypothetical protein
VERQREQPPLGVRKRRGHRGEVILLERLAFVGHQPPDRHDGARLGQHLGGARVAYLHDMRTAARLSGRERGLHAGALVGEADAKLLLRLVEASGELLELQRRGALHGMPDAYFPRRVRRQHGEHAEEEGRASQHTGRSI